MPELPEVETIRRDAESTLLGRRITGVVLSRAEAVNHPAPDRFVAGLTGRTIVAAERIAKYLLLRLDDGRLWGIHLSLEGRFLVQKGGTTLKPDTLLVVSLDDGRQLVLRDGVSYTRTYLLDAESLGEVLKVREYGPEPIAPGFTAARFRERFAGRRGMLKPLLLNQRIVAGIGNIYADEALWAARLHPARKANSLTATEWEALHHAVVATLKEGIEQRGTSARGGLYRDLFGKKGHHQDHLNVFRRTDQPCPRCATPIERSTVGGRATFTCPTCQPSV